MRFDPTTYPGGWAAPRALADRRGKSTRELWVTDPFMHRWLDLTRRLMHYYRVLPCR